MEGVPSFRFCLLEGVNVDHLQTQGGISQNSVKSLVFLVIVKRINFTHEKDLSTIIGFTVKQFV